MRIEHNKDTKEFTVIGDESVKMGVLEYMVGGDGELYATHTEVYPAFEGHGIATKLVDALVEYAISIDAKVIPICPYVVYAFRENMEKYAPVIQRSKR